MNADNSLLDKAIAIGKPPKENVTDADVVLALAWARGQVTITQCFKAWGMSSSGAAYVKLAQALAKAVRNMEAQP